MEIALIIVGGIVLITVLPMLLQNRGKKAPQDPGLTDKVAKLEQQVASLEERLTARDERVNQLEATVSFVNRLLDDKGPKA
jgi:hypothetical protein